MKKKHFVAMAIILIVVLIAFLGYKNFTPRGISYCNGMLGLDYGAAVDGPYYYVKLPTFKIIAECGGKCMFKNCSDICPPDNWTCK